MMKYVLPVLIVFFLGSCSTRHTTGTPDKWPFGNYDHVKAYLFNLNGKAHPDIIVDGVLNPSVSGEGTTLKRKQLRKAEKILHDFRGDKIMSKCYAPHHGFVYFDSGKKAVAYVSVDFFCEGIRFYTNNKVPDNYLVDADLLDDAERQRVGGLLDELEEFVSNELSLPVFHSLKEYQLYRQTLEKD